MKEIRRKQEKKEKEQVHEYQTREGSRRKGKQITIERTEREGRANEDKGYRKKENTGN